MKVTIVYSTKYGFTEKCAGLLAERVRGLVSLYNLSKNETPDLTQTDILVLGSSVYAGHIKKEMLMFINKNKEEIIQKRLMLFTCNMHQGEEEVKQRGQAYPEEITARAESLVSFGGCFDFSKLNFMERAIIKKVAKVSEDVEDMRLDEVDSLANTINQYCQ